MHITGISVQGLPPIENILVSCNERANLFVGPNATGKSTILRSIAGLYSSNLDGVVCSDELGVTDRITEVTINGNVGRVALWFSDDRPDSDSVSWTYIPATRINIGLTSNDEYISNFATPFTMNYSEVLDGTYIQRAINALHYEVQGGHMEDALGYAFSCARSICSEVILDGPHPHLEIGYDETFGRSVNNDHAMGIGTTDDVRGIPLHASVLSSGTQGTLLWLYALAVEMAGHYEFRSDWHEKPAILLIDEIENHLHPTWQRRVIPTLIDHFPGLQIFATTHSPFVVAGLKAGQVHLLSRKDGPVTISTNEQDIIGWTTDEILRTFMGVDEPTDQLTVNRAGRLRELRGKETLSNAEAEEMAELRRRVNEDFISSSTPLKAQRERYGDMMLEFLRSRQSELSQDGS